MSLLKDEQDSERKQRVVKQIFDAYGVLESRLSTSKSGYISNFGYSIADIAWIPFLQPNAAEALGLKDWSLFPYIDEWQKKIFSRKAVKATYH
jgi:glutathione S-transferase